MARRQPAPDFDLHLVGGGEGDVAPLGGQRRLAMVVIGQGGDAEPRAGAEHRQGRALGPRHVGADADQAGGLHPRRAQRLGGEIVDQPSRTEARVAQAGLGQHPVGIGEVDGPVGHRPGHGQHGAAQPVGRTRLGEVGLDGVDGGRIVGHGVDLGLADGPVPVRQGEARVGPADVPDQALHHRASAESPSPPLGGEGGAHRFAMGG